MLMTVKAQTPLAIELLVCYLVTLVIPRQHLPRLQNVRPPPPPPLFPKNKTNTQTKMLIFQWLFLVPVKGGRWHIIPQLAVHTTYMPLIVLACPCLLGGEKCYRSHLLREPETTIEFSMPLAILGGSSHLVSG